MSKKEKKVNEVAGKTSWNYQNHQNSQPRQEKGKLESSKSSKQSTKARKRQAGIPKTKIPAIHLLVCLYIQHNKWILY